MTASPSPVSRETSLCLLDVRPILDAGDDPFDQIMEALSAVTPDGVLRLVAPFEPRPLIRLLTGRGHAVEAWSAEPDVWDVEIRGPEAPEPLELRDLPAPEPLERVLVESSAIAPGRLLLARVPKVPNLLLPHLKDRGLTFQVHQERDGSALLVVRRPA